MKKIWFITGASKGLGLALVKRLLTEGYRVAATSRKKEALIESVGNYDNASFLPLEVDLTNPSAIQEAINSANNHFGKLDVLVNNAGYGIGGAIEELSPEEIKNSFDVNVFATIYAMQAVLPHFRAQRSGHIINISSIAGFSAANGWAAYAATKFAIFGLTEVTADDVKDLGIKATVVAPGAFRTSFLTADSLVYSSRKIDDYSAVHASHSKYDSMNGQQQGDPDKAAEMLIELAEMETPPVRFFMGSDAYRRGKIKTETLEQELEAGKELSFRTDFN